MKQRLRLSRIPKAVLAVALVVMLGCVISTKHTIDAHIVVDIRHIEEDTEDILDFIEGKTDDLPEISEEAASDSAYLKRAVEMISFVRPVYAAEKKISPTVKKILENMKERNPNIQALKDVGWVGETNRGYLELRASDTEIEAEKKNSVQQLIAAENADRKALYRELARLEKDEKITASTIEGVQAQVRLKRAKPGEIFQLPKKGKEFDAFKASAVGKRLGDTCVPEAWVTFK